MIGILLLLLKLSTLLKFSSFLLPLGSIFLSIATYAEFYGWKFAVGFVALIFFHELGHYLAAREKKLNVGLPTFIPFVGAWIELKDQPINVEAEAYVAYAGPFVGTLTAFAIYYWAGHGGGELASALAQAGFIINLFNLIPLHPLDGGRIVAAFSPRLWFLGVPILIGLWILQPSPMLILVAILAIPQLIKAWKYDPTSPENCAYYTIKASRRIEFAILYLGLAIILALMIQSNF